MEQHQPPIWYFAYGSNMSTRTFCDTRGIVPLAAINVRIPGWHLVFDIAGLPYQEPAFASIQPPPKIVGLHTEINLGPEVEGVAYLVTSNQLQSILASEGSGLFYRKIQLVALPLSPSDVAQFGPEGTVVSLTTASPRTRAALPSRRYKNLITTGAMENGLTPSYCQYLAELPVYHPPGRHQFQRWIGSRLFLWFWGPIFMWRWRAVMAATHADQEGHSLPILRVLGRMIDMGMWLWHDYIHSRIWGRGDGLDDKRNRVLSKEGGRD